MRPHRRDRQIATVRVTKKVWAWVNCGGDKKEASSIQTGFEIYSGVEVDGIERV